MYKVDRKSSLMVAGLLALVGWLAPASAAEPRVVARIDEPFEVDGHMYPGGRLSVREISAYSPVATLNEIQLNGESIGLLLARDSERPATSNRDQLIFSRSVAGHMVLVSIALRGERERTLISLKDPTLTIAAALSPGPFVAAAR